MSTTQCYVRHAPWGLVLETELRKAGGILLRLLFSYDSANHNTFHMSGGTELIPSQEEVKDEYIFHDAHV